MKGVFGLRILAGAMLVAAAQPVFANEIKIGFVDLQRALNESDSGKRAKGDFKVQVDKLETKLKGKKEELDRLKDDLERKASVLRDEERRKLEDDFQRKRLDLKRNFEDSQAEMQKKDNELTGEIIREIQEVIKVIGDREKFTFILELSSSPVLYADKAIDMTDQVLSAYNAKKN